LRSGAWDGALIELADVEWNDRILASPHQQRWRGDPTQQGGERVAAHVRLPEQTAGHLPVALDLELFLWRPGFPIVLHILWGVLRVVERLRKRFLRGMHEVVPEFTGLRLQARRPYQDHLLKERGVDRSNLRRNPATHRAADDMERLG